MHENLPTSILSEIEILRFDLRHCLTDELFNKVIDTVRFAYDEGKKEGL